MVVVMVVADLPLNHNKSTSKYKIGNGGGGSRILQYFIYWSTYDRISIYTYVFSPCFKKSEMVSSWKLYYIFDEVNWDGSILFCNIWILPFQRIHIEFFPGLTVIFLEELNIHYPFYEKSISSQIKYCSGWSTISIAEIPEWIENTMTYEWE